MPERGERVAPGARLESLEARAYAIPTHAPEADCTLEGAETWSMPTRAGHNGLGHTYADAATAELVRSKLRGVVERMNALAPPSAWEAMSRAARGRTP